MMSCVFHHYWVFSLSSRVEISGGYYEYIDVSSCQDIIHLYHLLWSATILNIVGLFLGIITAAILGGFKDMVRWYRFLCALDKTNRANCLSKNNRENSCWYLSATDLCIAAVGLERRA